ncbi:hypothetical protein CAC42_4072 [Sphaceloma murrayae]|uniref:DNA replication checkpoint mediator MRC1 domain-containing protein n=1 Tax=Sphaceloma murrayae TaxID=2082308 RepID=A0A2K1QTA4_9PEZI|nr:hypothetical protein CAC42_4072 [Sphaceloma murrayae]
MSSPQASSSEDDAPLRPIGRIAARMAGANSPTARSEESTKTSPVRIGKRIFQESEDEDEDEENGDAGDIYAQMKARLLGKKEDTTSASFTTQEQDRAKEKTGKRQSSPSAKSSSTSPSRGAIVHTEQIPEAAASGTDSEGPIMNTKPRRAKHGVFMQDSDTDKSPSASSESEASEAVARNRLRDLLARKRKEREQREAEEHERRQQESTPQPSKLANLFVEEEEEDDASEVARPTQDADEAAIDDKLTQQSRPTRKASKKAIEEMNKETQRMSRNMQLTHQAKVKKKFSIADFTAKFKKQPQQIQTPVPEPLTSSAAPSSDAEGGRSADTPPSSPPSEGDAPKLGDSIFAPRGGTTDEHANVEESHLPSLQELLVATREKRDKGKAPELAECADDKVPRPEIVRPEKKRLSPRKYRIHALAPSSPNPGADSDDDLEIVKDRLSIFSTVAPRKVNEPKAFHNLRLLAQLNGNDTTTKSGKARDRSARPNMTSGQLDAQLLRRAAVQVKAERDEKIRELRAKGIMVQTQEERERDMMEVENLLEKARVEAVELRKKEKALAKLEGREGDLEASDDESDEEWMEGGREDGDEDGDGDNEEEEGEELEMDDLSGSEDEDGAENEQEREQGLVDDAADEADEESDGDEDEEMGNAQDVEAAAAPESQEADVLAPRQRATRKKFVVDDDDEDEEDLDKEAAVASSQPIDESPTQVDDLAAAFGFGAAPKPVMSPSQMFLGTMAASQSQVGGAWASQSQIQEQDSMDLFNQMVPSRPSMPTPQMPSDESQTAAFHDSLVDGDLPDTQTPPMSLDFTPHSMQSPAISRLSQASAWPSPSQDVGFGYRESPLANAQRTSQSTVDTVLLTVPESPVQPRRGRLQQRRMVDDDEDDLTGSPAPSVAKQATTAFDVLRTAAQRQPAKSADFDRQKSNAKNMVDEQAEESEDEYAGLGGASDDDADGSGDEADKAMIDTSTVDVDERKLAAYYAERSREENEAQTSRLYKDLMSGALRRRGDAFEIDSDEDEQVVERRRRRQREEARKRRLLLGDERVGTLGGDGKKEAFLRAIEDRDEEGAGELDEGGGDVEEGSQIGREGKSQEEGTQDMLKSVSGNERKRKAEEEGGREWKRPSFAQRRNAAFVKPASLKEVRESVSFLIEEPHLEERNVNASDEEDEETTGPQQAEERAPFAARRTPAKHIAVVDRLLVRKSSSSVDQEQAGLAFVRSTSSFSGFKVPSLLKRATTGAGTSKGSMGPPALKRDGSSNTSTSTSSASSGMRGKGQRSSINYAAREAERRAVVDKVEQRRKADVKRIAGMRRSGGGGMAGFGGGFE